MEGVFICPIYDKVHGSSSDFEYGYQLFKSALDSEVNKDLFYIFSSNQQEDKFVNECKRRYKEVPNGLVYDVDLRDCKNPVSEKKFYGVQELANKYDYIAPIDCETVFLKKFHPGELMDEIWINKTYLNSNFSILGGEDVKKCISALGLEDNELLKSETNDYQLSCWFNEIPVYNSADVNEFFQWIKDNGYERIIYDNWSCFDYLVYITWRILSKGDHLNKISITTTDVLIESLWKPEIKNKQKIESDTHTHWTSRVDAMKNNNGMYLQFHIDRRDKDILHTIVRMWRERKLRTNG